MLNLKKKSKHQINFGEPTLFYDFVSGRKKIKAVFCNKDSSLTKHQVHSATCDTRDANHVRTTALAKMSVVRVSAGITRKGSNGLF